MLRDFSLIFLFLALVFILTPAYAGDPIAENTNEYADQADSSSTYVMGRPVESTYEFDITAYEPIDTALALDESGSMSGVMEEAKDGAKDYVDNTNTAEGDQNAIISFESSATTQQSLTSSKSDAKDAIDNINDGGGTDLPAGVDQAHNELNDGSNNIQVMIVLADGGGGDPGTEADDARDDGIAVHGIMYGSGASTSEFESLTDSSECTTDSSENSDGDNCWYAESGTIDSVYTSILEDVSTETDADLNMRLRDFAYTQDTSSYDSSQDLGGNNQEFTEEYTDIDDGTYSHTLQWRPTTYGDNIELVTGDSVIELDYNSGSNTFSFPGPDSYDVDYVDFNTFSFENAYRDNSGLHVEASIRNEGNVESFSREASVENTDGSSSSSNGFGPLNPSQEEKIVFDIADGASVLNNIGDMQIHADPNGYWDSTSYGSGDTLEPDEDNNKLNIGYPPKIQNIGFDNHTDAHAFTVEADLKMQNPEVDGSCRLYFNDQNGNRFPSSGTVEGDLTDDSTGMCIYENVNSSIPGFEVYEKIDVFMEVENEKGVYMNETSSNVIPNRPPQVDLMISPPKGSLVVEEPELKVEVSDPEGDQFNMSFVDYDTGEVIETVRDAHESSSHMTEWDSTLGEHQWRVNFTDPYDYSESSIWEFTRVIDRGYRLQQTLDYEYSSLILSEDGSGTTFIEITNPHPQDKEILTELESEIGYFNASFLQTGTNETSYTLSQEETQTLQVQVNAENVTESKKDELIITSTDQNVGASNTQRLDVLVRSSEAEFRDAPGLTSIYLVFIGLASVLLFGLSM